MTTKLIVRKATVLRKIAAITAALFFILGNVAAQDISKKVLAEIGSEKITVEDFLKVYRKNNTHADDLDLKSLQEYLDLYINFRLKVLEAEDTGLQNEQSFKDELQGYREQLAKPYLVDEEATERLIKEAYDRSLEDIRASHLLIRVEKQALPEDTLKAWNKTMDLYKRVKAGEKFEDLALEFSEDQSVRDREAAGRIMRGNKGDLGYFSAFDMIYAFESGAYALQKGDVSKPIRSEYGYHLIYIVDRKPAMGKALIAHILLLNPSEDKAKDSVEQKEKINEAYNKLLAGEPFEDVARTYSDDRSTADKGGVLQWFGSNRMIPDFIYQISLLKEPGEFSKPFHSHIGWHIIKLLELNKPGSFEDSYTEIKDKVQKNERSVIIKQSLVKRIKNEYGFKENPKSLETFYQNVTDSVFSGSWSIPRKMSLKKELFTIGQQSILQQDFADYIVKNQRRGTKENIRFYVDEAYKKFVENVLLDYEDKQLENKYPEFKALVNEYRDGILLFELTDKKIWSRAVQDTIGLTEFHKQHENDYMWDKRADASVYTLTDTDNSKIDLILQMIASKVSNNEILDTINIDTQGLTIKHSLFQKGENEDVDATSWEKGTINKIEKDNQTILVFIHNVLESTPKKLNEVRKLITTDYQNYLEKEWIQELRAKFPVKVNNELLTQIK